MIWEELLAKANHARVSKNSLFSNTTERFESTLQNHLDQHNTRLTSNEAGLERLSLSDLYADPVLVGRLKELVGDDTYEKRFNFSMIGQTNIVCQLAGLSLRTVQRQPNNMYTGTTNTSSFHAKRYNGISAYSAYSKHASTIPFFWS